MDNKEESNGTTTPNSTICREGSEQVGEEQQQNKVVNINIGILGHVDAGKTSLVRALSTKLSTAALDKHPQSKERGITIDLGFSAFTVDAPQGLKEKNGLEKVQYTLVDCPGHASLIKTIIGGASVIDRMILVVDVTKGIQTQTAECLIIGEILASDLTVVLNKIDLLPESNREKKIQDVSATIDKALSTTKFSSCKIIAISAIIGGDGKAGVGGSAAVANSQPPPPAPLANDKETVSSTTNSTQVLGIDTLVQHIKETTTIPNRGEISKEPLYYAVDHCFAIKGQGTILTGTVLGGSVSVGEMIEIPMMKEQRKVKSMQMFREPVQVANKGDRVALCVTNLNAKALERGILTSPGSVPPTRAVLALVRKVKYFQLPCTSKSKIHVTIGHTTTLGTVTFFGSNQLKDVAQKAFRKEVPSFEFDSSASWEYDEALRGGGKAKGGPFLHWALIEFEQPVICQLESLAIASRLDMEADTKDCRLAFHGRVMKQYQQPLTVEERQALKVYKLKERVGSVDRIADKSPDSEGKVQKVIGKGMFNKDSDLERFINKKLVTKSGEEGILESSFGKTGKYNVYFRDGAKVSKNDPLILRFKHMIFSSDNKKQMLQD